MDYRDTDLYRNMTPFQTCEIIELNDDSSYDDMMTAFQWLHDTGMAYQLQGFYGRTATALLDNGLIER
jgi:hypothetical protein